MNLAATRMEAGESTGLNGERERHIVYRKNCD
jgi:hypothetical protein